MILFDSRIPAPPFRDTRLPSDVAAARLFVAEVNARQHPPGTPMAEKMAAALAVAKARCPS